MNRSASAAPERTGVTLPTPSGVSTSTILAKNLESVAFMQRLAEMEAFVLQMLKNDKY